MLDKLKQNRSLKILVMVALFVLFASISLASIEEQSGITMTYKLDSGVRRDTINKSDLELTFSVRSGVYPHVLNKSGIVMDLMQTLLPPTITDTKNLFNWSSLQTEVVWTALSLVLNNSYGTVDFATTIDLSNVPVLDLDKYVNISSNYIEINGTAIPQFNTTAKLTLSNLTFNNVRVLKDGTDCTECDIISYSYNNLVFNAPGFTIYQAAEGGILPAIKISTAVWVQNTTMQVTGDTYNSSYPANVTIDVGNDGLVEWNYAGELNSTQTFWNFSDALRTILPDCTCTGCSLSSNSLTCTIDIAIDSETQGTVELSNLNITQVIQNTTWNRGTTKTLIDLDDYFYDQNGDTLTYTTKGNSSITVAISDGVVSLSAGNWYGQENVTFYANDSTNVTKSNNVSLTITYAAVCGDGTCDSGLKETCSNCAGDCGSCGAPRATCADISCDDGDACTKDSCHIVDSLPECYYTDIDCDDNNICTDDNCDSATGCVYTPNTDSCDDNNDCTEDDVCSGGSCSGKQITCDTIYGEGECWDGSIPECTPTCSAGVCGACVQECIVPEKLLGLEPGEVLFDLSASIRDKEIEEGEDLVVDVTIIDIYEVGMTKVRVSYFITDMDGKLIKAEDEMVSVDRQVSYTKTISTEGIEEGFYIFTTQARFGDSIAIAKDIFNIVKIVRLAPTTKARLWVLLIIAIIIVIYLIMRARKKGPKVKIREDRVIKKIGVEKENLEEQLSMLEEDYASSNITEDFYIGEKNRIKNLIRQIDQKAQEGKLTEEQIDEIERNIERSSREHTLVGDILKELEEEGKAIKEGKPLPERPVAKPEEEPLPKEQIEAIEEKVEESEKHKVPSVYELVQQTKERFKPEVKKIVPQREKKTIIKSLKENIRLKKDVEALKSAGFNVKELTLKQPLKEELLIQKPVKYSEKEKIPESELKVEKTIAKQSNKRNIIKYLKEVYLK